MENNNEIEIKKCKICGEEKPITEYYRAYYRIDDSIAYKPHCKECEKAKSRAKRKENKEYYDEYNRKYRMANKWRFKEYYEKRKEEKEK